MTMKPFEIQSTALSIGGVKIETSLNSKLVIPGITRATVSVAIEVQDTQDQTRSWNVDAQTLQIIDGYTYEVNYNGYTQSIVGWTAATYAADNIDGEGFIDGISVVDGGAGYTGEAVTFSTVMYASEDGSTWYPIPFRVRCGAGDIESEFGSGGGGVTVGEIDSEGSLTNDTTVTKIGFSQADGFSVTELDGGIMKINFSGGGGGGGSTGDISFSGTSMYATNDIDIYTDSNQYAEVWLRDNYDVLITADGENTSWKFQAGGNLVFPDGTVQQTAYVGGGGSGSGTLYKARAKGSVGFTIATYNESEDTLTLPGDLTGDFYQNDIVWADATVFETNNFMPIDSLEYDSGNNQTIIYLAYNIHGVNYTNSKLYTVVDTTNFTTLLQGENTSFEFDPANDTMKINVAGGAVGLGNLYMASNNVIASNDSEAYINFDAGDGQDILSLGTNNGAVVKITTDGGGTNFTFDSTTNGGKLTFPDGSIQTTAFTGGTGGSYKGYSNVFVADNNGDPYTLSNNTVGGVVQVWGSDIILPDNTTSGDALVFTNQGGTAQNIIVGTNNGTIYHGSFFEGSQIQINDGETLELVSRGDSEGTEWDIVGGSIVNRLTGTNGGTGNLTFISNGIYSKANDAPGWPNGVISLYPGAAQNIDYVSNGQYLDIYPTWDYDQPHIHIAAGQNNGTGDLMLGPDSYHVDVNHDGNVYIRTGAQEYQWRFGYDGSLELSYSTDPGGNNSKKSIKGAVETIYGDPWPHNAESDNGEPALIWTASADDIVGAKMTLRFQSDNYMEMLDVMMAKEMNSANVSYSVSNRVKTNDLIDDAYVSVGLDGSNRLVVTALASTSGNWTPVTYSVTEFKRTYD